MSDDERARQARAEELRREIARLTAPEDRAGGEAEAPAAPEHESPRDFIHRKMREEAERGADRPEPDAPDRREDS